VTKLYSYLGLAQRAGKLTSGEGAVESAVRRGRVCLLIVAQDASLNTRAKFVNMAKHRHIDYVLAGEKAQLGMAVGKAQRAVIGVLDKGFAALIKGLVEEKN
jgi:ribosomal protein L7Ae-like RNA K-turn-binding protein